MKRETKIWVIYGLMFLLYWINLNFLSFTIKFIIGEQGYSIIAWLSIFLFFGGAIFLEYYLILKSEVENDRI